MELLVKPWESILFSAVGGTKTVLIRAESMDLVVKGSGEAVLR